MAIDQRFIDAVVEIVSWNKSNQTKQGTGFIIRKNLTKTIYILIFLSQITTLSRIWIPLRLGSEGRPLWEI